MAVGLATAVDHGLFNYTDKVVDFWPAFGKHGKEKLKIEDILRHEAGLSKLLPINGEGMTTDDLLPVR